MATKGEITAIRTEYASVYDYHSDALVEAMAAVIADTRRAYLAASQTITKLTDERDALRATIDYVRFVRKPLPAFGGFVCDDRGVLPPETVQTLGEYEMQHDEALAAVASLRHSHEALRETVERVRAYLNKRNHGMLNSVYQSNVLVPTSEILAVLDTP